MVILKPQICGVYGLISWNRARVKVLVKPLRFTAFPVTVRPRKGRARQQQKETRNPPKKRSDGRVPAPAFWQSAIQ